MRIIKSSKLYNTLTVVLFIVVIFGVSIAHILKKDVKETAEEQNLQTFPELTWDSLKSGDFANKTDKYFSDQFPMRSSLINLKAIIEKAMLKGENNGILLGKNGQQADKDFSVCEFLFIDGKAGDPEKECDVFDKDLLDLATKIQLENIVSRTASAKEKGITLTTVIPPRTIDAAASAFDFYPTDIWDSFNDTIRSFNDGKSIIYMLDEFKDRYENGEYVYYRTDHHWTSLGAYYCYLNVMRSFGMEEAALPIGSFDIETASDGFYGAFYRTSGYKLSDADLIDFYKYRNDDFETQIMDIQSGEPVRTVSGLFDYENLNSSDQYTAYISGKNPYVRIVRKDGTEREKLILVKDSFGQCLAPFLAQHFDLEIYDFSVPNLKIVNKAEETGCSKILIVCNAQNLIEQEYLKKFR